MRFKVLLGATLIAAVSWTAIPTHAAFPGANGKIAYARYPRGSAPYEEIYTVNPDGTGQTRLTHRGGLERSNVAPAVSPDGTMIAFHRYTLGTGGADDVSDIVIIEATTTPGTPATEIDSYPAPTGAFYAWPSWSPDGTYLLIVKNDDVATLEVATGNVDKITNNPAWESRPQWSPDGDQITFNRESGTGFGKTLVADINSTWPFALSNFTTVTDPGFADGDAKWHPTQDKLVLSRWKSGWSGSEIFVENLATGTQKRHTNNSVYDAMPAYSPDGDFIVYSRGPEDGDAELIRQNVASGTKKVITSNNVVDQQADWGVQPTPVP
ncbi:MAG: hypothetical protein M3391_03370 [Actinomycetota bacterium]|nr:hypothetical protein [Actinomycetota bacterium]